MAAPCLSLILHALAAVLPSVTLVEFAVAAETSTAPVTSAPAPESRALDDKIESLKRDVLELNRDLGVLEEELLYPASTQVAMFLSLDAGVALTLEAVDLKLDGAVIARHRYTDGERRALARGGMQRLYLGNLGTGKHQLVAVFAGKRAGNRDYRRGTTVNFEKAATTPKYLELKIVAGTGNQLPAFRVKEW